MSANPTPDPSQQPAQLPPLQGGGGAANALSSLFSNAHETAAQQEADFERNRQADIAMYTQELMKPPIPGEDPEAAATRRQKIADQIGKLRNLGKGQDNPLQGVATVLSNIHRHVVNPAVAGQNPASPSLPGAALFNSPNELDGGGTAAPTSADLESSSAAVHPAVTTPATLPPVGIGTKIKNLAANVGVTAANVAGAGLGVANRAIFGATPPSLPPLDASLLTQGAALPIKWDPHPTKGKDLDENVVERNGNPIAKDETLYATGMQGNRRVVQPFNANPSQMAPRTLGTSLSIPDAQQLQEQGEQILSPTGQPYDMKKLMAVDGLKLQAVGLPGGKLAYVPGTERQVETTVGNEKVVTNEFTRLDPSQYVALGQARTATNHSAPGVVMGPNGEQSIGTVVTGSAPSTPGMAGAYSTGLPPLTPGAQMAHPGMPATGTVNGGGLSPIRAPGGATVATPTFSGQPRAAGGAGGAGQAIPFSAANVLNQRLVPVREAAVSLFGDPETGISPLASFAHIASNPDDAKKVGTAVKLTLDGMEPDARSGGLWQAIQDQSGLTAFKQKAANQALGDQLAQMTPDQRQAYDALLTAYSTAIGLRTLTRASAAQFSVKALENEIPIPGYNTSTPAQFYDQLSRLAQQINNGAKTIPNMPKAEKDTITKGVQEFAKLAKEPAANVAPAKEGDTKLNSHGDKVKFSAGKWGPA